MHDQAFRRLGLVARPLYAADLVELLERHPCEGRSEPAISSMIWLGYVPFHRQIDAAVRNACTQQDFRCEAHHDFRAAHHRYRLVWIEGGAGDQLWHYADIAVPACIRMVDRHFDVQVETLPPQPQFFAIENGYWVAAAKEDGDAAVKAAIGHDAVNGRAERGETQAAGHDDHVRAFRRCNRPPIP